MTGELLRTNILIIDDSEAARAVISRTLRLAGFGVFELSSAIGATRMILRNRIAAAIVDLSMPGLSGDKLVGVLRSNPRLSHLVLVVVSGNELEELKRISEECDVDAVLSKRDVSLRLVPLLDSLVRSQSATFRRARALDARVGNDEG